MSKINLSDLEAALGVEFKNRLLLVEALTHRSYLNEDPKAARSNERLEFLGDSVLSLLTSTRLFKEHADFPEGKLTSFRSAMVRTQTLAKIALDLGLGKYLFMSRGEEQSGGRENLSLLADTFEAVLGAIYLDCGLTNAGQFLENHFFSKIEEAAVYDFKSKLQEVIQETKKVAPVYKVFAETGPDHDKTFTVGVLAKGEELGRGVGKSKQEAQQDAARVALETITR